MESYPSVFSSTDPIRSPEAIARVWSESAPGFFVLRRRCCWVRRGLVKSAPGFVGVARRRLGSFAVFARRCCSSASSAPGFFCHMGFFARRRLGSFAVFARRCCSSAPGFVCSSMPGFFCRMGFFNTTEVNCVEFVVLVVSACASATALHRTYKMIISFRNLA
nr:hypothetical protein CFP56_51186 [Quercus suber]